MEVLDNVFIQSLAVIGATLLLWRGADTMVDAVAHIARVHNISELVIGLTLVAFGTSAPEMAVSIGAALNGQADISVGNIVGSNIFNLGIILGGCAAIRPILTSRTLVYRDGIFLLAITLALGAFISDFTLSRIEGITMFALLAAYLGFLFWRKEPFEGEAQAHDDVWLAKKSMWVSYAVAFAGLLMILLGSKLLVFGASGMARAFGLSDWVIAVTIVAAGTSAPEVVTSLTAAFKGHHGISAGGLIGSDLFNLLGVLGVAAMINPLTIASAGQSSVYVLIGMVAVVIIFMRSGWRVSRPEGLILLSVNLFRWWFDISGHTV